MLLSGRSAAIVAPSPQNRHLAPGEMIMAQLIKNRKRLSCIALLFSLSSFAAASPDETHGRSSTPIPLLGRLGEFLHPLATAVPSNGLDLFSSQDIENRTYQIGSEWGKKIIQREQLDQSTPAFRRAVLATARTGGATGFFLGEFAGQLVMATNHHVYPSKERCEGSWVQFPLLEIDALCQRFIGTWEEVDLSLFVIDRVSAEDRKRLLEIGSPFDFASPIQQGQELITVGFGIGSNPRRRLVANQDSDCKVYSQTEEFRLMPDPDELNPGTYEAWSFANGCDVSHGDSGSAMVDRKTGRPIGLIWTGRIPKNPNVQDSQFLAELFATQGQEIWTELSYAVPAKKIESVLRSALEGNTLEEIDRMVVEGMLNAN